VSHKRKEREDERRERTEDNKNVRTLTTHARHERAERETMRGDKHSVQPSKTSNTCCFFVLHFFLSLVSISDGVFNIGSV
jgi:hypothetical protein